MLYAPSWPWHTSAWGSPCCSDLTEGNGSDLIEGNGSDLINGNGSDLTEGNVARIDLGQLFQYCDVCVPNVVFFLAIICSNVVYEISRDSHNDIVPVWPMWRTLPKPMVNRIHRPLYKVRGLSPWSKRPGIHTPLGCQIQHCGLH